LLFDSAIALLLPLWPKSAEEVVAVSMFPIPFSLEAADVFNFLTGRLVPARADAEFEVDVDANFDVGADFVALVATEFNVEVDVALTVSRESAGTLGTLVCFLFLSTCANTL
jgi:hypothetical protein